MTADTLTAYKVQIPNADLEDLRARLGRVRWPDEVAEAGWDYSVPLAQVRERAARWRDGFDWRAQEKRLNAYPQSSPRSTENGSTSCTSARRSPAPCR